MRGVCALNFEAMNILNPDDPAPETQSQMSQMQARAMGAMEAEMHKGLDLISLDGYS